MRRQPFGRMAKLAAIRRTAGKGAQGGAYSAQCVEKPRYFSTIGAAAQMRGGPGGMNRAGRFQPPVKL